MRKSLNRLATSYASRRTDPRSFWAWMDLRIRLTFRILPAVHIPVKMDCATLPACVRIVLYRACVQALVRDAQPNTLQVPILPIPQKSAPPFRVFPAPPGYTKDFAIASLVHADSHQDENCSDLASPA